MNIQALEERYAELFPDDRGMGRPVIEEAERRLSIRLPEDLHRIAEFWSGGGMGVTGLEMLPFENSIPGNVVERTLELRSAIGLPDRFVVLAEPSEAFLVLDAAPEAEERVLFLDAIDAENLATGTFESEPDTWPTFADFFDTMLDEEEEER